MSKTLSASRSLLAAIPITCLVLAAGAQAAPTVSPSHPDGLSLPAAPSQVDTATRAANAEATFERLARRVAEVDSLRDTARTDRVVLGEDPVTNLDKGTGYATLALAVADANPGDTLQVEISPLPTGLLTLDRDLTIQGATGFETITATTDTGSSGDARAWFLVDTNVEVLVRDLRFDGAGQQIHQAFRIKGGGSFLRTAFEDIQFNASGPDYAGSAIVAFGDDVDVIDSTFQQIGRVGVLYFGAGIDASVATGNLYVGKGDGNFLDYGFELNGGASAALEGNRVSDARGVSTADGSTSAAFLATTFLGSGTKLMSRSNDLVDNTTGIAIGADSSDTTDLDAAFDRLVGNSSDGIASLSTGTVVAEREWWGCNGGPGAPGCDTADGAIDFDPWLTLRAYANDDDICTGFTTPIVTDLFIDSDGVDTSMLGTVPDGILATFAGGTFGTVSPTTDTFVDGEAVTTYTSLTAGDDTLTATVDNETVTADALVEDGMFCDDFESGNTNAWSSQFP